MSLEAKMARRFPQKVKVGDLIGLPVEDDDDIALGHVQQVVRSPEDKIKLIVTYSRWFGWFGRPVAVPMEAVAILGKEIASLEMPPAEYKKAPTWVAGTDRPLPESEIIRIRFNAAIIGLVLNRFISNDSRTRAVGREPRCFLHRRFERRGNVS